MKPRVPVPDNVFYGWWLVGSGFIVQWYTSAVFWRGFQAFFLPIVNTFGWSQAATAGAISLQRVEGGMFSPFVGTILDRYGPRWSLLFGTITTGAAFILMSRVNTLWQFYLAVALMTLGMSFGTFIVFVTMVSNWFIRNRARALAILMTSSAIGGFTLPLLVRYIDVFGWRDVLFAVGVGFWIMGIPAIILARRRPEDYGQLPDGDEEEVDAADAPAGRRRVSLRREASFGIRQALRTPFFWQLGIASSLGQLVSSTNLLHLAALRDFGVSPGIAALAAGAVAFGDLIGRGGTALVGDRFDKRHLLAWTFFIQMLGVLSLALVNAEVFGVSLGMSTLPVFVITFGMGFGASVPLRLAIIGDYFGRRNYGSIVGLISSVNALFGAIGPVFVGLMFDVTDSYRPAFMVLFIMPALAIPLTLTLERPGRVAARSRRSARASGRSE